jgi:hypothetical protein
VPLSSTKLTAFETFKLSHPNALIKMPYSPWQLKDFLKALLYQSLHFNEFSEMQAEKPYPVHFL